MNVGPFELNRIYIGNARELAQELPEASIDLIFCDPVYNRIEDYAWLGTTALQVLKPGGSLVAQAASMHRYAVETVIRATGLTPQVLLVEELTGGFGKIWSLRIFRRGIEYVWFTKGERTAGRWVRTIVRGGGRRKKHKWGDSALAARTWIEQLTDVGDIVWDPFTGSAMVPIACIQASRNFIAFEIDAEAAAIGNKAIVGVTRPMLAMQQGQMMELIHAS